MDRRILDMGALVSTDEAAVTGHTANRTKAMKLREVNNGVVTFTMAVISIPEKHLDTTLYACPYVEYETETGSAFLYGAVLSDSYNSVKAKVDG